MDWNRGPRRVPSIRLKKYAPNMHPNLNRPNNIFPKSRSEGKLPEPPQGIERRPTDWWTVALQGYLRRCSANKCHALNDWSRRRESNPRPTAYETVALPTELRRRAETKMLTHQAQKARKT